MAWLVAALIGCVWANPENRATTSTTSTTEYDLYGG